MSRRCRMAGRLVPTSPVSGCVHAGVYFPANGKFYAMGGRVSDGAGNDFTHPFEYDPVTQHLDDQGSHLSRQPGEQYGLWRAHRRRDAVHLLCGRLVVVTPTVTTGRVFRYDPVTDTISFSRCRSWPAARDNCSSRRLHRVLRTSCTSWADSTPPRGRARDTNQIWEFTPSPAGWVQKPSVLPVPLGYIPTTTIGSLIYTGGGSDITAGVLTDTTNSFVYNPVGEYDQHHCPHTAGDRRDAGAYL